MDSRIKMFLVCLFISLFMFVACARRSIVLENVYAKPNIDFNRYRRLAIVEFTPNTVVKKDRTITQIFEDEFQKQGYDVIRTDEVNSVLEDFGLSRKDLLNPETLNKVSDKLQAEALIIGEVKEYEVEKKDEYVPIWLADAIIDFGGKINVCDISLMIEMLEGQEGKKCGLVQYRVKRKKESQKD